MVTITLKRAFVRWFALLTRNVSVSFSPKDCWNELPSHILCNVLYRLPKRLPVHTFQMGKTAVFSKHVYPQLVSDRLLYLGLVIFRIHWLSDCAQYFCSVLGTHYRFLGNKKTVCKYEKFVRRFPWRKNEVFFPGLHQVWSWRLYWFITDQLQAGTARERIHWWQYAPKQIFVLNS